ncbi:MAG: hypothetical protein JNL74_11140 [Fibrobacteres bacterium]|nr:hypothetical protein [Fibrobacterota bacterium]
MRNSKTKEAIILSITGGLLSLFVIFPGAIPSLFSADGSANLRKERASTDKLQWWEGIRGCGVGGGAGGGGGGAKWIGRGVTGGQVDLQLMSSTTLGGDYEYSSLSAQISKNLFNNKYNAALSLPWSDKSGTFELRQDQPPITQEVGGFGDMGLSFGRKFGESDQGNLTLTVGLPTGKYNHRRHDPTHPSKASRDTLKTFVTPELQSGSGLYNLSFSYDYVLDKDWGPSIFGISYTAMIGSISTPFSRNGFGAQNDIWSDDAIAWDLARPMTEEVPLYVWYDNDIPDSLNSYKAYDLVGVRNTYHVRDKSGKDMGPLKGDYVGDVLGLNAAFGLKEEKCIHSLQFSYSYKISPDWYLRRVDQTELGKKENRIKEIDTYYQTILLNPVIRDQGRHSFNLAYGLEISSDYFPFFLAGSMAFNTKEIMSFGATLGLKGSFF